MRLLILTFSFGLVTWVSAQRESFAHFGVQQNLHLWNPQFRDDPFKTTAGVHRVYAGLRVFNFSDFHFYAGLAAKWESYGIQDYIKGANFYSPLLSDDGTGDLHAQSKSYGMYLEAFRSFHPSKRIGLSTGLQTELYLLERYEAYSIRPVVDEEDGGSISGGNPSACTASIFCRAVFFPELPVTFATKLSLGTSLYADWDVFSRYVWFSLGLEIVLNK